ncbi:MAG: AAA family ATPase [Erysipelotrichaceae bacterium]|nr:AAA family ATPase [Erysipelotrichaceae bacterium]
MFRRKVYQNLADWKNSTNGTKALLIEGARRIGKSTVAEEFGKAEYRSYLLIDFSIASNAVKGYFTDYLNDLDMLFMLLSAAYGTTLYRRESLIIFDEVQMFPFARQAIKHLVKDGRFDYLETGSLISIKENVKEIVIPSEERKIKMYPIDFEEFLSAMGEEQIIPYIKTCFESRQEVDRGIHNKAMMLFKTYMLVGGMPKAVSAFLENDRSFAAADAEKRDILNLYRDDIMKIKSSYRKRTLLTFDQIPGFLSTHEKRIVYRQIKENSKSTDFGEPFFWLADSMICNECFNTADPNIGLSVNEERTYVKCYMVDTGLLLSHAFDENAILEEEVYRQILQDRLSLNEGMLYENAISQMLAANGHKLFFYTHYSNEKHRNDIEIDFLLSNNSKLKYRMYPIEVKSSKKYTTKSLQRFRDKYKDRIGDCYIIHPGNLSKKDDILCIPPYMTIFL